MPAQRHTRTTSIYQEGWDAYMTGVSPRWCPHTSEAAQRAWFNGYYAASEWWALE